MGERPAESKRTFKVEQGLEKLNNPEAASCLKHDELKHEMETLPESNRLERRSTSWQYVYGSAASVAAQR